MNHIFCGAGSTGPGYAKEPLVQRPWGGSMAGRFGELRGQGGWNAVSDRAGANLLEILMGLGDH